MVNPGAAIGACAGRHFGVLGAARGPLQRGRSEVAERACSLASVTHSIHVQRPVPPAGQRARPRRRGAGRCIEGEVIERLGSRRSRARARSQPTSSGDRRPGLCPGVRQAHRDAPRRARRGGARGPEGGSAPSTARGPCPHPRRRSASKRTAIGRSEKYVVRAPAIPGGGAACPAGDMRRSCSAGRVMEPTSVRTAGISAPRVGCLTGSGRSGVISNSVGATM